MTKARAQDQLSENNTQAQRRQSSQRQAAAIRFNFMGIEPATRSEDRQGDDGAEEALRDERVRHGYQRLVCRKQDADTANRRLRQNAGKDDERKTLDPPAPVAEPGPHG